jgi:nicotinate-nucleotide adenylyltransferase
MKIGLFFGSFNPVHIGHMIIANFMATQTNLEEVWLVVSPHNPLKDKKTLAKDRERFNMVQAAIGENTYLKASEVEFKLPKPSYTIDTLTYLKEKYPKHEFVLIMGSDNIETFHKWKNYEKIIENHSIYVYNRPEFPTTKFKNNPNIQSFNAPLMQISSTYIRDCIKNKKNIQYLVPESVFDYLLHSNLYKS